MSDELIRNVRARIEQCRRLAKYVNDPRTTEALLRMADEGEADLKKVQAEEAGQHNEELKMPPPPARA